MGARYDVQRRKSPWTRSQSFAPPYSLLTTGTQWYFRKVELPTALWPDPTVDINVCSYVCQRSSPRINHGFKPVALYSMDCWRQKAGSRAEVEPLHHTISHFCQECSPYAARQNNGDRASHGYAAQSHRQYLNWVQYWKTYLGPCCSQVIAFRTPLKYHSTISQQIGTDVEDLLLRTEKRRHWGKWLKEPYTPYHNELLCMSTIRI